MTYFNAKHLPPPENEYVCWLDLMGTKSIMSNSMYMSGNFIFKLHATVLEKKLEDIKLYPIMDGVYITTPSKDTLIKYLVSVFRELADGFMAETKNEYKFMAKASVSYGPIIHGQSLSAETSRIFEQYNEYVSHLMIGLPMVQSFMSEVEAPPFGVFIHESARAFSSDSEPFQFRWWKWFRFLPNFNIQQKNNYANDLLKQLGDYYKWLNNHSYELGYKKERIQAHKEMLDEYFRIE